MAAPVRSHQTENFDKTFAWPEQLLSMESDYTAETPLDLSTKRSTTSSNVSGSTPSPEKRKRGCCDSSRNFGGPNCATEMSPPPERLERIIYFFPSPEEPLIVLLQYTEWDQVISMRLIDILRSYNIIVRTLDEISAVISIDADDALSGMFQLVHFIVPVLSVNLLRQVHPQSGVDYQESQETKNNRCLYQLYTSEYREERCLNFRLKPVLAPDFDKSLLRREPVVFKEAQRLWNEVTVLVKILKDTRKLMREKTI